MKKTLVIARLGDPSSGCTPSPAEELRIGGLVEDAFAKAGYDVVVLTVPYTCDISIVEGDSVKLADLGNGLLVER